MPSSVIAGHDYDPGRRELTVRFRSGRCYRYFGVPRRVAAELAAAPSKGRYFNAEIRDVYPFGERDSADC